MDRDPELDVTVSDGRQVLTFQIAALAGREAWVIVEPRAPRRVIRGCAAALEARQRLRVSPGSFGWDGAFGTHFWADPKKKMVGLLLVQTSNRDTDRDFENAVMQAIVE